RPSLLFLPIRRSSDLSTSALFCFSKILKCRPDGFNWRRRRLQPRIRAGGGSDGRPSHDQPWRQLFGLNSEVSFSMMKHKIRNEKDRKSTRLNSSHEWI